MFDDYPEKFLEEGVLAKKYVKKNIFDERFKRDYFLRISHLEENTKGFFKLRQLKRKDKDQVFSSSKIRRYIEVKTDFDYRHGFIDYFVERYNNQQYIFIEADYPNLYPHDIEDIYKRRRHCINKKGVDQDIIESLKIFMRSTIIVPHIEDFHIGIESYQRKISLTPLVLACPGIQKENKWTCFEKPNDLIHKKTL
nr:guanine nucleotide binding protein (G-protein), alpha subunit [Tanacetum cinerariifolium]